MERGLQGETIEFGDSIPSHQLTQQAASIGMSPMPLKHVKCYHRAFLTYITRGSGNQFAGSACKSRIIYDTMYF